MPIIISIITVITLLVIVDIHENTAGIGITATESGDSEVVIVIRSCYTIWKCERTHITRRGIRTTVKFKPYVITVLLVSSVNDNIGITWLCSLSTSI